MRLLILSKSWWIRSYWQPHFRLKRKYSLIFTRSSLRIHNLQSGCVVRKSDFIRLHWRAWSSLRKWLRSRRGWGQWRTCSPTTSKFTPSYPRALCRPSSVSLRCITTCSDPAVRWAAVPPGAITAVPGLVRERAVQLRVAARQAVLVPSAGRPQWLWGRLRQHRRSRGHQVIFYCECFWETFILLQQF